MSQSPEASQAATLELPGTQEDLMSQIDELLSQQDQEDHLDMGQGPIDVGGDDREQCAEFSPECVASEHELSDMGDGLTDRTNDYWIKPLMDVIGSSLSFPKGLRYGSDCSGVDAPKWSLDALTDRLPSLSMEEPSLNLFIGSDSLDVAVKHVFASEAPGREGLFQKYLLMLNKNPNSLIQDGPGILWDDMLTRGAKGLDWRSDRYLDSERVDIYTAGSECQDRSSLNRYKKPLEINNITSQSGGSSTTLAASLTYIKDFRPKLVLIENTHSKKYGRVVLAAMRDLQYVARLYIINSRTFRAPESRTRVFCVAVDPSQVTLAWPPAQWASWLSQVSDICMGQKLSIEDVMLPATHPIVEKRLADLKANFTKKWKPTTFTESLDTGKGWAQCFKRHQLARETLGKQFNTRVPCASQLRQRFGNEWSRHLCAREQDVLYLHLFAMQQAGMPLDSPVTWDLTNNIDYPCWKDSSYHGVVPCLLRDHTYYNLFHQ
ncbi:unnamed protein product, partial [Polarella glacialis]